MSRPPPHKFYDDRSLALRKDPVFTCWPADARPMETRIPKQKHRSRMYRAFAQGVDAVIAVTTEDLHEGRPFVNRARSLSTLSLAERNAIRADFESKNLAKLTGGESTE